MTAAIREVKSCYLPVFPSTSSTTLLSYKTPGPAVGLSAKSKAARGLGDLLVSLGIEWDGSMKDSVGQLFWEGERLAFGSGRQWARLQEDGEAVKGTACVGQGHRTRAQIPKCRVFRGHGGPLDKKIRINTHFNRQPLLSAG